MVSSTNMLIALVLLNIFGMTQGRVEEDIDPPENALVQKMEKKITKEDLKMLLEKRKVTIFLIYNCTAELSGRKVNETYNEIVKDLEQFKEELKQLESVEPCAEFNNFTSDLWLNLKAENLSDAVQQYVKIIDFFLNALECYTKNREELTIALWSKVKNFVIKPINFLGTMSNDLEAELNQYSVRRSSTPGSPARDLFEHEILNCRKEVSFYQMCSKKMNSKKQRDILNMMFYKLDRLKKSLSKMADEKSKKLAQHINDDFWTKTPSIIDVDHGFRKYQILYNIFVNQLYYASNNDYTDSYWRTIWYYLKNSSNFSSVVTGFEVDACQFGNVLECFKRQIEQRRLLADAYYSCTLQFDRKKQLIILEKIGHLMTQLMQGLKEICKVENERNKALHKSLQQHFSPDATTDVTTAFKKYEYLLNFFELVIIDDLTILKTPYWKKVDEFINRPFEFSGVLNFQTTEGLVQSLKTRPLTHYDMPVVAEKKKLYQKIWKRIRLVRAYHACANEFEKEKKYNMTESVVAQFNALKSHADWGIAHHYLVRRLHPAMPNSTSTSGIEEILQDYESMLYFYLMTLQGEQTSLASVKNEFWTKTDQLMTHQFF